MRYVLLVLVLCFGFASAGLLGSDLNLDNSCGEIVSSFEGGMDFVIPDGVPFSDDVFDVYIDDEFFVSFELVDKKLDSVGCEMRDDVGYRVYVSEGLLSELESFNGEFLDFYNEKRASGDLRIDSIGVGNSLKMGFIKFGLWVAGFFG